MTVSIESDPAGAEASSTTWLAKGWGAEVDEVGNLLFFTD